MSKIVSAQRHDGRRDFIRPRPAGIRAAEDCAKLQGRKLFVNIDIHMNRPKPRRVCTIPHRLAAPPKRDFVAYFGSRVENGQAFINTLKLDHSARAGLVGTCASPKEADAKMKSQLRRALALAATLTLAGIPASAQTEGQKIAQGATAFSLVCAKSLPSMRGVEARVRDLTAKVYDNAGGIDQPGVVVQGGSITTGVAFTTGSPAWKGSDGMNFCDATVYGTDRKKAVQEMLAKFNASKPASVSLTPIEPAPQGAFMAWQVSNALPGMQLRATRAPRSGMRLRLVWPN